MFFRNYFDEESQNLFTIKSNFNNKIIIIHNKLITVDIIGHRQKSTEILAAKVILTIS